MAARYTSSQGKPLHPSKPAMRSIFCLVLPLSLFAFLGCVEHPVREASRVPSGVGKPEWIADAVIYEVFVPDFSPEGTFQGVIKRLDSLQALGVTTLWLMPIHPVGKKRAKTDIGPLGSPYAVRDYYAVNPDYGTAEDFRALVDSVHARGMYIIIDLVANHTAWDHPWVTEHPDWYTPGPIDGFTYPVLNGDTTDWTDVVDLNYDNPALRQAMIDVMQYWVREFDIDGYRCDVAHGVPLDFWRAAIDSVEKIKPVLMLAEAAEPEMHLAGFDLTYAWPFYHQLKEVFRGAPLRTLVRQVDSTLALLPPGARRLRFTTNHDETMWDAPPPVLFGGQEGAMAAFVLATSMPGVPLLYNGQELGTSTRVSFFARTPYRWDAPESPATYAFYRRYVRFYRESQALRRGTLTVLNPEADHVLLYLRAAAGDTLLLAVNVRNRPETVTLPARIARQRWVEVFRSDTLAADRLELPPYAHRIYRPVH